MENETNVENQTTTTESSAAAVPSVESKSSSKIVFLVLGIFFLCVLAAGVIGAFIYVRSTEVKELNENTAKEFLEEFTELNVEDESYRLTMNLGRGQEVISEFDSENGILHSKYSSERVEEELEYYVDSKNNVVYSLVGGEWTKSSDEGMSDSFTGGNFLTLLYGGSDSDLISNLDYVGIVECKETKKCYEFMDNSSEEVDTKFRFDPKSHRILELESRSDEIYTAFFEYDNINLELPEETKDAIEIDNAAVFGDTNNTKRSADVNIILNAVTQYISETGNSIEDFGTIVKCSEGADIIGTFGVDLAPILVDSYILEIPSDPSLESTSTEDSGYGICLTDGGQVEISAPNAENEETISVRR